MNTLQENANGRITLELQRNGAEFVLGQWQGSVWVSVVYTQGLWVCPAYDKKATDLEKALFKVFALLRTGDTSKVISNHDLVWRAEASPSNLNSLISVFARSIQASINAKH